MTRITFQFIFGGLSTILKRIKDVSRLNVKNTDLSWGKTRHYLVVSDEVHLKAILGFSQRSN